MANETPQSGLDAIPAKPKSAAERSAEVLAAGPNSADMLQRMQQRVDELSSPWHKLQSGLDDMVARARNNQAEALRQRADQKQQEAQEIQNNALGIANVRMMQKQLGDIGSGLQGGQGSPMQTSGQPPQQGGQQNPTGESGYSFKGVPLTQYEYQTLKNYYDQADISGFNAAFKAISDIHSRAQAESAANWGRYDVVEAVVSGYDNNGNYKNFSVKIPKVDLQNWQDKQIVPPQLKGVLKEPKIEPMQKKATGGAMRSMAVGGDPQTAPVAPVSPQAAPQGSMAENIISLLTGSGSAEAAPPAQGTVSVSPAPGIDYSMNPDIAKEAHKSALQQEEARNQAQLESEKAERDAAGKFIADISTQSAKHNNALLRANEIIKIAAEHPEDLGYEYKQDPMGLLLKLAGSSVDKGDAKKDRETGTLMGVREFFAGEPAMERRTRLDALAKQLGIDFEKEEFGGTGSKMGAQLTNIAQSAKGLGSKYPASQNIEQALFIQNTAQKNMELAEEWDKYKIAERKAGRNPDAFSFMQTPKTKAIIGKWDLKLNDDYEKLHSGKPADGTEDKDKYGNPIVWKDGKPMRVKK